MADLRRRSRFFLAAALIACVPSAASWADLSTYTQDFEGLGLTNPSALANDGWLVFGNVFDGDTGAHLYGYGPFGAPNGGEGFCAIAAGQGGPAQGLQQLSVYNDYNNPAHAALDRVEANVYREQNIGTADAGKVYTFAFDAKRGNIGGTSTAAAFIKVINPATGYSLTILVSNNMTSIPVDWANYSMSIVIRPEWAGQLLQFGFLSTATSYEPSGIFYDNVAFGQDTVLAVDDASAARAITLANASPNPFNPRTTLTFELSRHGRVQLQLIDANGRRVRTLVDEPRAAGAYSVAWDGRDDLGQPVASGVYVARLVAGTSIASRRLVLVK